MASLNKSLKTKNATGKSIVAEAQGRLPEHQPIAIIDIGSNSIRLVVYEGLSRSPAVLFNEKVLCGLGKGVAQTGKLDDDAVQRSLDAIKRFYKISSQMTVSGIHILATAASREASNGDAFIKQVERICNSKVQLLSGAMEAHYAGLGANSGIYTADGIVGDLGGGSMELIPTTSAIKHGVTTPLGGLRLQETSKENLDQASEIARKELSKIKVKWPGKHRRFYAIGGTWRSLARLHMHDVNYPLEVVHGYTVKTKDYIEFCKRVIKDNLDDFRGIEEISKNRQNLLPYGAAVLIETLSYLEAKEITILATGVREGYLYSLLNKKERQSDALLQATGELAILRARSPKHSLELADWTGKALKAIGIKETKDDERWRKASCNLADIAWRSASDYRAEQTLGIINNAGFNSISHEGRAYLAIVNFHRHQGMGAKKVPPVIAQLASEETNKKARLQAALFRLAYLFSASVEGILPKIEIIRIKKETLVIEIPKSLKILLGERVLNRLDQLSREVEEEISVSVVEYRH